MREYRKIVLSAFLGFCTAGILTIAAIDKPDRLLEYAAFSFITAIPALAVSINHELSGRDSTENIRTRYMYRMGPYFTVLGLGCCAFHISPIVGVYYIIAAISAILSTLK